MTAEDLPRTARWLQTPEVRRWWSDEEEVATLEDLEDPNIAFWIVSHEGRPFAYLQDYDPHAWQEHPFGFLPAGSRGMDQLIGEPDMLGAGHGSAFIRAHVERLFARGAPAVGADPHPDNARAIRAYEKAGFQAGHVQDTEWGRCLLMTRNRE
jgi:aminoglycoside 6'-N-acetyltransferase